MTAVSEPLPTDAANPAAQSSLAALAIVAIALLNWCLSYKHGNYEFKAAVLLIGLLGLLAMLAWGVSFGRRMTPRGVVALAGLVLLTQTVLLITQAPGPQLRPEAGAHTVTLIVAILALFGTGLMTTLGGGWLKAWTPAFLLVAFAAICLWVIFYSYKPFMDVWVFQQEASAAFAHGQNPYAITFPNIYGPDTPYYAPEVVNGDRVTFGFPYMPLPLLTEVGSWLISGDVRLAHLAAFLTTFAILAFCEAGPLAWVAVALFATSPELARICFYGWSEPLMFPWLALTALFMRKGKPFAAAAFFGLVLASKQYCVIFVPLAWFLLPAGTSVKKSIGLLLTMAGVGALPTLPIILWNFPAFWYSTVTIQMQQPFRTDALSISALIWDVSRTETSPALAFLAIVPAYVLVFLRFRRTPSGLMAALAFVATLFFALNKQAFLNYYSLVLAALAIGLAHQPSPAPVAPGPKAA